MTKEDGYAIALGAICVVLLAVAVPLSVKVAAAPRRAIRVLVPVLALVTAALFAVFDVVARTNVRG